MERRRCRNTKGEWKEMPLTTEVLDKFSELITTALGLVAALAWNRLSRTCSTAFSAGPVASSQDSLSTPPS